MLCVCYRQFLQSECDPCSLNELPVQAGGGPCQTLITETKAGVTHNGSMPAFLPSPCQNCYSAGSSLAWGLNFGAKYVSFSEACCWGFSLGAPVSSPPSSVHGSAHEMKVK